MTSKTVKLLLHSFIIGTLLIGVSLVHLVPAHAAAGDSEETPIFIADCEELQAIDSAPQNLSKHYALNQDIDCSGSESWSEGKGFDPIASNNEPFTGTFNGNHHTITNLTINRADDEQQQTEDDEQSVGLFAWTQNAEVYDLNVDTSKVKGYQFVGGIVGWAESTDLTNVSFNASVEDNSCDPGHCAWARYGSEGGGLVGVLHNSTIVNGVSSGPVKGSGNTIGGLVGSMGNNSSITNSLSSSNIDGGYQLGGAVGLMTGGALEDVHATGSIVANNDEDFKSGNVAGGLVGRMGGAATITQSSASGNVHVDYSDAGGLIGIMDDDAQVEDSYARGNVEQSDGWTVYAGKVGGLVGSMLRASSLNQTYASGSASGNQNVGGLVGHTDSDGETEPSVNNSFAVGAVSANIEDADPYDGGFVGNVTTFGIEMSNNYYDADRTGMGHCYAQFAEVYQESEASVAGECTARNTQEDPNAGYFYDADNQPFKEEGSAVWSSEIWDFHEDDYPTFNCDQCEVIEDEPESGNGDGEEVDPILTFVNGNEQRPVLLEQTACPGFTVTATDDEHELTVQDPSYNYTSGFVSFTMSDCEEGETVTVSLTFAGEFNPNTTVVRKYNTISQQYNTISSATKTVTTLEGQPALRVSYQITDGGELDQDGEVNGTIIDPVGLGVILASQQPSTDLASTGQNYMQLIQYIIVAIMASLVVSRLALRKLVNTGSR